MTFTFNPALATAKDRIRLETGDVGKRVNPSSDTDFSIANAFISDQAIQSAIANAGGDERAATVAVARNLAGQYAQMPTRVTIGPDTWDYGARLKHVQSLITSLTPGEAVVQSKKLVQLDPDL